MASKAMKKSPLRILLNAEPFGFGPTAAIASFFPHLRENFDTIGYVGKKHTLDLQRDLPYDAIHDVTDTPKNERLETMAPIFADYDIFVTAMDHKMLEFAQASGLKTVYYDALAWYWPGFPPSVRSSDLYIAQDFFGVGDRLKKDFSDHGNAHIVAPIIPETIKTTDKKHVLINLGGLQNPFWPIDDIVSYANHITHAIATALPDTENIIIAGSKAVSERLSHKGVKTYQREDMKKILAESKMAFMTPGLGNIYDAGAFNIPTVWLPPANDSQGQQLDILQKNKMIDGLLSWHDIVDDEPINYKAEQLGVLTLIADTATYLAHSPEAQSSLIRLAAENYRAVSQKQTSKTAGLIHTFGTKGEEAVSALIIQHAQRYAPKVQHE